MSRALNAQQGCVPIYSASSEGKKKEEENSKSIWIYPSICVFFFFFSCSGFICFYFYFDYMLENSRYIWNFLEISENDSGNDSICNFVLCKDILIRMARIVNIVDLECKFVISHWSVTVNLHWMNSKNGFFFIYI